MAMNNWFLNKILFYISSAEKSFKRPNWFLYGQNLGFQWVMVSMVFSTEGFFGVAIESWPEWDLNP